MGTQKNYVIGADFGTDSVRCMIVDTNNGNMISCSVAAYPRWKEGKYQHPEKAIFRQHPLDYLEAFEKSAAEAIRLAGKEAASSIRAIGVDTTGSTPCPVDKTGTPLALNKQYADNENAMFYLWKDHSAEKEADQINQAFSCGKVNYCKYMGKYSAEWYWAKILHAVRTEPSLRKDAFMWVEHCDWMVAVLTGNKNPAEMYHSACASGHKALWHSSWHGLPDKETLRNIDPYLSLVKERYGKAPTPSCTNTGRITREWAEKIGVSCDVVISGSCFDAHAGAVGAGIREETIVCSIGTSAADMMVLPKSAAIDETILHYGGMAEDSILPGYIGIETGQAAFGDIFSWYRKQLMWPYQRMNEKLGKGVWLQMRNWFDNDFYGELGKEADGIGEDFPVSLDWFNGRRYPDAQDSASGAISGITLGTSAPAVYKSLVFGALSGMKRIITGFSESGLKIRTIIAVGGIARKSDYIMQMMADMLDREVLTVDNEQTCALGAAIYAAVSCGCYENMEIAAKHMSAKIFKTYLPNAESKREYTLKYNKYIELAEMMD